MATTAPDNIRTPDAGDQYALVQDLGAMADTVQLALNRRANAYAGTAAQRQAFSNPPVGVSWQDTDGDRLGYTRVGGSWVHTSGVGPWVSLSSWSNGFAPAGGGTFYRLEPGVVRLRGAVTKSSTTGNWEATGITFPPEIRPTFNFMGNVTSNSPVQRAMQVTASNGWLQLYSSASSSSWFTFDGVTIPLT